MARQTEFSLKVGAFADALGLRVATVLRRTALAVQDEVTKMTPVDTGRARSNWNVEIDTVNPAVKKGRKNGKGAKPTGRATAKSTFYVSNNVEYISELEYGSSTQAPHGMLRVVIPRHRRFMEDAAKRVLGNSRTP